MNENEELEKVKCQSIYQNLLDCRQEQDMLASAYIREFWETARCDTVATDFSPFRKEFEGRLNARESGALNRILSFDETEKDEKVAAQACGHYSKWHNKQIVSALNWTNWLRYHTIERAEKTLAVFGIGGGLYAGYKVALASFRMLKKSMIKK